MIELSIDRRQLDRPASDRLWFIVESRWRVGVEDLLCQGAVILSRAEGSSGVRALGPVVLVLDVLRLTLVSLVFTAFLFFGHRRIL